MDRELVLAVLAAAGCGGALTLAAWCPPTKLTGESGRVLERRAWRRLWSPFAPALLLLAALCGWALVEPATAERVPTCLVAAAVPFVLLLLRALWRGVGALRQAGGQVDIGVVGLWRPRIVVSGCVVATLDGSALAAALAHERAHARHRDPLRIWLANFATDLLWPWGAATQRLRVWARALELARDEEARRGEPRERSGTLAAASGADLAAAVLGCARLNGRRAMPAATLGGETAFLQERIARLLQPVAAEEPLPSAPAFWCLACLGALLAGYTGCVFGEHIIRVLFAAV